MIEIEQNAYRDLDRALRAAIAQLAQDKAKDPDIAFSIVQQFYSTLAGLQKMGLYDSREEEKAKAAAAAPAKPKKKVVGKRPPVKRSSRKKA